MKICSSFEMLFNARSSIRRPSNITVALGVQEWFASEMVGSKHRPTGELSASVTRNAFVAIWKFMSMVVCNCGRVELTRHRTLVAISI